MCLRPVLYPSDGELLDEGMHVWANLITRWHSAKKKMKSMKSKVTRRTSPYGAYYTYYKICSSGDMFGIPRLGFFVDPPSSAWLRYVQLIWQSVISVCPWCGVSRYNKIKFPCISVTCEHGNLRLIPSTSPPLSYYKIHSRSETFHCTSGEPNARDSTHYTRGNPTARHPMITLVDQSKVYDEGFDEEKRLFFVLLECGIWTSRNEEFFQKI